MRVVSWNVRGGGRSGVINALAHPGPDVAVLIDVRARHVERLRAEASHLGFPFALAATQGDVTGVLALARQPMRPGLSCLRALPGRSLPVDATGGSIIGLYAPLVNIDGAQAFHDFWGEITASDPRLGATPTLLVGDFNTCLPVDSQSGRPLPGSRYLERLVTAGWRDAFRELHPSSADRSYWNRYGGFRIDHCFVSVGARLPWSVAYITEIEGFTLVDADRPKTALSDHAALLIDW